MHPVSESFGIFLKLSPAQVQWLDQTAALLTEVTGRRVGHSAIMMRLMEFGLPQLEQEMQSLLADRRPTGRRRARLRRSTETSTVKLVRKPAPDASV